MIHRDEPGEKTEMPTPLRLKEARRRGQVPRSADLTSAAMWVGAFGLLWILGGRLLNGATEMTVKLLDARGATGVDVVSLGAVLWDSSSGVAITAGMLCLGIVVLAVLANVAQVGLLATAEPLRPDFSRISPCSGFRRIFSLRSAVGAGFSLCKIAVVAVIALLVLRAAPAATVSVVETDCRAMLAGAARMIFRFSLWGGIALFALAVVDYLYQRWEHLRGLKMTPREVREDLKRTEGDPLIRSRRRSAQKAFAFQRVAPQVARATVVIASPDGPAVAVRYDGAMRFPRVTAAGAKALAARIRQVASAAGVAVVEDETTARRLYRSCRAGGAVPRRLYDVVAEIIAYARCVSTGSCGNE